MNSPHDEVKRGSFAEGFAWFSMAVALIRSQLIRLLLLGLVLQFLGGFTQVGVLGVLFILAVPALTAGMLQGMHHARLGQRPSVFDLFAAFKHPQRLVPLLILGGLSIALSMLLVGFLLAGSLSALDPDLIARIQAGDQSAVAELDPALIQQTLFGLLSGLLLSATLTFFAVPLIWFKGLGLWQGVSSGLAGLLRHWKPLTGMGLVLAAVGFPVGLLAGGLLSVQLVSQTPSAILTLILLVIMVVYQVLIFGCQYIAFCGAYQWPDDSMEEAGQPSGHGRPDSPSDQDDQLVA